MDVLVERIAEAEDEADGAETGVGWRIGAALDQLLPDHPQQDLQDRRHCRRIGLEEVAQAFRQRQDPLAHRQRRKDMISGEHRKRGVAVLGASLGRS